MAVRLIPHGAPPIGKGPSSRGQHGRQHQDQKPVRGWGGTHGLNQAEYRPRTCGDVQRDGPSMGVTVACPSGVLAPISPSEGPISQLSHAGKGLKRANVEARSGFTTVSK